MDGYGHRKGKGNDDGSKSDNNRLPNIHNGAFNDQTEKHIEDLKSGQNNILVAVRTRPLNKKEVGFSNFETIRVLDSKVVILLDPSNQFESNDIFRANRNKEQQYAFDCVFDNKASTQTIFQSTTKFLIPGVLNGFNATVFAYGPTGAGKTYTMLGSSDSPGIMALTMDELFKQVKKGVDGKEFSITVSYLEVYNETLRDLLSNSDTSLDLREDPIKGVVVSGITEITATEGEQVMDMLKVGSKNRIMEATGANVVSSRSHAVLQVQIEYKAKNQGIKEEITVSKLSLIDLAGSERAANTNNKGARLIEGANINKSLLALGNCITLLSDKQEKGGKIIHIPYRDSKLTRLLKDSLGGNCRTVMIANLSPAVTCFDDTYNTLKYANRAKNIKTSLSRNVLQVENHVEKYTQIIAELKNENERLKGLLQQGNSGVNNNSAMYKSGLSSKEAGFVVNEGLVQNLLSHFEDEMKVKKRIHDLEMQSDDVDEKMFMMKNEMNGDDKASKDRFSEYENQHKRLPRQVDELKKEFNILSGRRSQLNARIQTEKNKDSITYLSSIFKQNQMMIENLDLVHKERRNENQVRLKDRQIKVLENQLGLKGRGSTKEPKFTRNSSNGPSPFSHDTPAMSTDDAETHSMAASLMNELRDLDSSFTSKNTRDSPNNKKALYLPNIRQKRMDRSPGAASQKIIGRKVMKAVQRGSRDNSNGRQNSAKSLPTAKSPPKFYYKKQEFILNRLQPLKEGEKKTKKKYAYLPSKAQIIRGVQSINTSMGDANNDGGHEIKVRPRGQSLDRANEMNRKRVQPRAEIEHPTPLASSKDKRKNILSDLNNRKVDMSPKNMLNNKVLSNHARRGLKLGDSPYVDNVPERA